MKIVLLFLSLFISIQPSFAQQAEHEKPERKHAIYAELLGTSMPFSFGYAYSINRNYEIRIGAGYMSIDGILSFAYEDRVDSRNGWLNFPVIGTRLIGKKRHLLELNAGIRIDGVRFGFESSSGEQFDNEWKYYLVPIAGVGYRYQGNRILFFTRINTTELELFWNDRQFGLAIGLGFGFRF